MSVQTEPIRLGICGAGKIVDTHLAALARLNGFRAVAVSSRTLKSARALAERFGIGQAYGDHRRIVESPEVDLVLIAVPNYQHAALSIAALRAGKHVLVEKPLAATVGEAREMVRAAKRAGRWLFYAEQLPLAPKSQAVARAAQAGLVGNIYMVRQIERHAGPHSPWFFKKEFAAGGVLMDLGCHSISTVLDILPGRRVESVSAVTRQFVHRPGDVEDFALLQMRFAGGIVGVVEDNWCHPGGMDCLTEVFGDRGSICADLKKGSGLRVYSEKGSWADPAVGPGGWQFPPTDPLLDNGYLAQFAAVENTLRTGAPAPQTGVEGLRVMRIMEAAYRSAAKDGRPVRVSL